MKLTKRPATETEAENAMRTHIHNYRAMNPGFEMTDEEWQALQDKALAEGNKNEVCGCGCVFLAFQNFTRCRDAACPFSTGVSVLDLLPGWSHMPGRYGKSAL